MSGVVDQALAFQRRAIKAEAEVVRLRRLLDEFDRYASIDDGTPYAGSPFEAEVRAALADTGEQS